MESLAEGLLAHMRLSDSQASVLLDQTSDPGTLRVFIFDTIASRRPFTVKQWRGYRVDIVRNARFEPQQRVAG
jgi:hypothetical protein